MIYGDEVETPNIDKLREEGITFTNAFSQSSTTIPSLYSLFTSKYLSTHGVISQNPKKYKGFGDNTLPVILGKNKWRVGMFSGLDILEYLVIRDLSNLIAGRDSLPALKEKVKRKRSLRFFLKKRARSLSPFVPNIIKAYISYGFNMRSKTRADILVDKALRWLSGLHDENFFLWIHFFDAHLFYTAPDEWIEKYYKKPSHLPKRNAYEEAKERGLWFPETAFGPVLKRTKDINIFPATYKAALSYIDEQLGKVVKFLKDRKRYENTLIIVTADHGENLLENGIFSGHAKLFDATTKVPLILRDPDGIRLNTSSALVQHMDLMPTLLERFQIEPPEGIEGKSLWPCINADEEINEFVFSEHTLMFQSTIRNKDWQYLWSDGGKKHPWGLEFESNLLLNRWDESTRNYAPQYPEICREMEQMIHRLSAGFDAAEKETPELDPDLEERLTALGYIDS
jgi:arylsulfatase A-like enzyme